MRELVDSMPVRSSRLELRQRLRRDGYVLFRGLLDRAAMLAAWRASLAVLQDHGWLEARTNAAVDTPRPIPPVRQGEGGEVPQNDSGHRAVSALPEINRLSFEPNLQLAMATLVGDDVFAHPVKVVRGVYPDQMASFHKGRIAHQDIYIFGVQDVFTTWIPIGDVPSSMGGLALQIDPPPRRLLTSSYFDHQSDLWATTDYRAGDVLVFHGTTMHAAMPNMSNHLRLSVDFRWQSIRTPLLRIAAYPKGKAPVAENEHWAKRFSQNVWWRPLPAGVVLMDEAPRLTPGAAPPSLFVDT